MITVNKNLEELTDDWLELLRNRQYTSALHLYCQEIIPLLLPDLRTRFSTNMAMIRQHMME
jgi:hypothetical protein